MKTIPSLIPGSPDWLQSRSASKAPAMMGASKYQSRSDLLKQMATGIKEDVDAATQARFDAGHASEAAAREIAEDILCDGLSPVCGESDDGYLTASFDGLTFDGKIGFEHKLWRDDLAAAVRANELPEEYRWQMDQQILVGGLDYVLFMVSDGTREKMVSMEYRSTNDRALALLAGWRQLDLDVEAYTYVEPAPEVVAAPVADLPVLFVQARGEVTETNMPKFKADVAAFLSGLNMLPKSDQELVDGKAIAEKLRLGAKALQVKKAEMLAQTASIGEVASECDLISKQMNAAALSLEKAYDAEHENRKHRLIQKGRDALAAHIATLGQRIDTALMPLSTADFAKAIKSKSKIESMENGIATELARATIEANAAADKIDASLKAIDAAGYAFLFSDRANLVRKAPDDLALVIKSRIADHLAAEAKKLEAIKEAARVEAEANAAAKVKADQEEAARQERLAQQARDDVERQRRATETAAQPVHSNVVQAPSGGQPQAPAVLAAHTEPAPLPAPAESIDGRLDETAGGAAQPRKPVITIDGPFTSDIQIPKPDDGARIRLGEISDRLGFTVTADFISSLGFQPVETIKAAKMYRESEFPAIVASLIVRLEGVLAKDWRKAA